MELWRRRQTKNGEGIKKKRKEGGRSVERAADLGRLKVIEKPGRWGGKITGDKESQNILPNKGTSDNFTPPLDGFLLFLSCVILYYSVIMQNRTE